MKIALIGSAPSSVQLAPYKDASYKQYVGGKSQIQPPTPYIDEHWQIWGCSPGAYGQVQRADVWFELHRWEPGQTWFSPEYCQWLAQFNGPVYTGGVIPELPSHVVYPIAEIENEFTSYFLTSSLSLMFALAIYKCAQADEEATAAGKPVEKHTIGMWGVDMAATDEYGYQRAGCQFFILEALRRGIEVYIPPESDILRPMPVYGMCEWDHNWIKATARMRELKQREANYTAQIQGGQQGLTFMQGALENQKYNMDTWTSPYGLESGKYLRTTNEVQNPIELRACASHVASESIEKILDNGAVVIRDDKTAFGHARIKKPPVGNL